MPLYDNGTPIAYDAIGNPRNDGTWIYNWSAGRQLKRMSKVDDSMTVEFKYNAEGLRTRKIVIERVDNNNIVTYTDYTLHGKLITHLVVDKAENGTAPSINKLHFFYDNASRPAMVKYNGVLYTYVHNLQGDIVGIVDAAGNLVVEYKYDAWGKPLSVSGSLATTLGKLNPFRYRGYVCDEEIGLYYLQSRYYNYECGRFINEDSGSLLGVNGNFASYNLFSYCGNNPIIRKDTNGLAWETIWDALSFVSSVDGLLANPYDPWAWLSLAGDTADILLPFIGGIGETARAFKAASNATEIVDAASDVKKGWKVGEDITALTKAGNIPSWSTIRSRYWKNKAKYFHNDPKYIEEDIKRMQKGLAPQFIEDGKKQSMELHHILGREGNNFYFFFEITPKGHSIVDPYRQVK